MQEQLPFDNVKDQIGYCGIWCGSCVAGNGALQNLTKAYKEIIEKYALEQWAPKDFNFAEFKKGLESIQAMEPCPGCLQGGGNPECHMRKCAMSKQLSECAACDQIGACEYTEELEKMRTAALDADLNVTVKKGDHAEEIEQWTKELKKRFPHNL